MILSDIFTNNINRQRLIQRSQKFQFSRKYQQAFLEDLASLIEDGVPASQAIDVIVSVSSGVTKKVAQSVSTSLAKGQSLADGMQPWFSHAVVEVIRVGESNGALPQTLRAATGTFTQYASTLKAFLTSVLYPLSVVVLALGITVFIKNSVLNSFLQIKPLEGWPLVGKNLYRVGATVQEGWWLMVITAVFGVVIINNILKNVTGRIREYIDEIPLISLYRSALSARFMETLGLLLSNGVVVRQALTTMQHDASPYLSWHLLQMEYHLSHGKENIADVLNTNLISYADLMRLRIVGKGKGFDKALISLGRQELQKTSKKIEVAGKFIGAFFLFVGAAIAMTIVLGIYTVGSSLTF